MRTVVLRLYLSENHSYPVSYEMGISQIGDYGSLFLYENGDLGPYFHNILGTPGSPFSQDFGDPLMKMGTPTECNILVGMYIN